MSEESSKYEIKTSDPKPFQIPVEIGGLGFSFEGTVPTKPSGSWNDTSKWALKVPEWEKQADAMQEQIKSGKASLALPQVLARFIREKGVIGSLDLTLYENHVELDHIRTASWALPPEYGYNNAKGLGSFLLRNFVSFAEIKGLPSTLYPYPDGSSPLSDEATLRWYERYGYKWAHDFPKEERVKLPTQDKMVRLPQNPDLTQPIARILQLG